MSFRTKLLASHVALVVAVGLIAILSLDRWLTADLVRQVDQRLEEQAKGAVEWAEEGGRRHPEKVAVRIAHIVDAEVTLFDRDGLVIGSSTEKARIDLGPEVEEARRSGIGHAARVRAGEELHYAAAPGADGIVVRLGLPLSDVAATAAAMRRRLLFASAVAILAAIALGILASRVASRPLAEMTSTATRLAEGDFDVPMDAGGRDEFGVLWRALKSLARQLKARISELVAERDQLSAILTGMVEGVLVIDASGSVIVANPAATRILGAPTTGVSIDAAVKDDEIRGLIARCMRGEVTETELEIVDRRGAAVSVYVRPLGGEGTVVAVLRDMTHLRRLMTIRREFVANVSHELRTPVTSIQGYAETLLRGKADASTERQFLEIIHRQAQRIGALVEQLLALSELESRDRQEALREPVKIGDVARHVAEAVRGRADARGMTVTIDVADDTVAAADPEGVERALLNLVDNAIKYGDDSGTVKIAGVRANQKIVVTIADDGPGIAPAHLLRIFERFYRVDPGRARQHGGAGLGLAIVKHLVEAMDGSIDVKSVPGKGTVFFVTLVAAADGFEVAEGSRRANAASSDRWRGAPPRA